MNYTQVGIALCVGLIVGAVAQHKFKPLASADEKAALVAAGIK